MKKMKKVLALVLAVFTLISCTAVASFAATKRKKPSKYDYNRDGKVVYTVLGDSIPAGYSLPGFWEASKWDADWPVVHGSYPEYVGKAIGAKVIHQDAHIGLRSTDLRYLLCDDYAGDIAVGWRVPTTDQYRTVDPTGLAKVRKQYYNDVKSADVITLGIGINDLTIPGGIVDNVQRENRLLLQQHWGDMLNTAYHLVDNTAYMSKVTTLLFGFYRNYMANFDAIIQRIKQINPTAKVLVIGYYNAAQDAFIKGALPVDIGMLVTPAINAFNSHAAGAAAGNGYTYVKMEHIDTFFCDRTSVGYLNDNHPTLVGHKQMADKILKALNA